MINGVIENLTTRLSYFPFGKYYYFNIEESIFSVIETYVKMTEKFCLQELADNPPEEYHQFFSNFKSDSGVKTICISKALCVKVRFFFHLLFVHKTSTYIGYLPKCIDV